MIFSAASKPRSMLCTTFAAATCFSIIPPHLTEQLMKHTLIILNLLIALCINSAKAQKAYDIITYKTNIYGDQAILQLADGYLLASKVIIRSEFGNQEFAPSTDEPDTSGDLRFDAIKGNGRFKHNKGSWLTLKKINGADYPKQIKAVYWDGKMQKKVLFNR
jgi:hypothetical protein